MITRGLSCDCVGFSHFLGGGQVTPLAPLATGLPKMLNTCSTEAEEAASAKYFLASYRLESAGKWASAVF